MLQPRVFSHGMLVGLLAGIYLLQAITVSPVTLDWDVLNTLAIGQLPFLEIVPVLINRDFHPPAAHWLVHVWSLFFNTNYDPPVVALCILYGVACILGVYLLIFELTKSKLAAFLSSALMAFCPFIKNPFWTLQYLLHVASMSFSWYFYLRLVKVTKFSRQHGWILGGYAFFTLLAVYNYITAVMWLLPQLIYFYSRVYRELERKTCILYSVVGALLGLSVLPFLWNIRESWHVWRVVHGQQISPDHIHAGFLDFLFLPANLIFLRYDLSNFITRPELSVFLAHTAIVLPFLIAAYYLSRKNKDLFLFAVLNGLLIPFLVFAITKVFGVSLFNNRTLLFSAIPYYGLIGYALSIWYFQKRWLVSGSALLLFICIPLFSPFQIKLEPAKFWTYVQNVKAFQKPGDGIFLARGYFHLSFMRYFDPDNFGLTQAERHADPVRENVFNMVQRIDGRYFFVSGDKLLYSPEVQRKYELFLKSHPRVLVIGFGPELIPMLNCRENIYILRQDGLFEKFPCVRL